MAGGSIVGTGEEGQKKTSTDHWWSIDRRDEVIEVVLSAVDESQATVFPNKLSINSFRFEEFK